jgi:RNase P subunit RPR2
MKKKLIVCLDCGNEQRIEVYDREDAERLKLRLVPPTCGKCGSHKVRMHDS